jgi:hypothetical protein
VNGSSGVVYDANYQTCIFEGVAAAAGGVRRLADDRPSGTESEEDEDDVMRLRDEVAQMKTDMRQLMAGQQEVQAMLRQLVGNGPGNG